MSHSQTPTLALSDGHSIPQLGLGTYLMRGDDAERVVGEALDLGYRHLDTAAVYQNEAEVGRAIVSSGVPRDEIFVTTKLATGDQERPSEAFDASLQRLGLNEVDLYLVHWPLPEVGNAVETWRSLIEIGESGRARSIGVSNFEIEHLTQLIDETGIVPAVNQIEVHPYHQRRELIAYCAEQGIAVEAWGPLAQGKSDLLQRAEVTEPAAAHGKTAAQIVLRWHAQEGRILLPKTSSADRLRENAAIFDFELSDAEIAGIASLEQGKNFGPDPRSYNNREYFHG